MAYDRADWHYGGDYPEGLPPENGGTHIGMFLAWAITRGLEGSLLKDDAAEQLKAVRDRGMTGRDFLFQVCDEKFWEDDLNDEGNLFAKAYYETGKYIEDYGATLGASLPSLYHVDDSWQSFDAIAAKIDQRFEAWMAKQRRKWWEFWK